MGMAVAAAIALGPGTITSAQAAGYAIFTQGASPLGQGNAVTGHTDSPSTVFYNPALMNRLDGTQFEVGTTFIVSSHEFDSGTIPGESTTDHSTFFPSTVYATHKINDSWSVGLGIFNPFGLGTDWNDRWEGRYIATKSELTTYDINPAVSWRVIPSLTVAAGLDVILLDATLERQIPSVAFFLPPGADIGQKFKGDGTGVGFNVGLAYDVTDTVTVGASYRSETRVDINGHSSTSLGVTPLDSPGKSSVKLPQQVTAGISYRPMEPLVVEAGIRWEGWSAFKELNVNLESGAPVPPSERNWHDTLGMNVGAKYRVNDTVALMGGYIYGENAVPDSTFDPSIPDSDTHIFCTGAEFSLQRAKLALSYAYQHYVDRTKNNTIGAPFDPANGRYKSDAHLVAVSLGYRF